MRVLIVLGLLVRLGALAACSPSAAEQPPTEPPPTPRFDEQRVVRFHMSASFDLVRGIERLLIGGKLDDATAFARMIASAPDTPGLGRYAVQLATVRERAATLARATTLDDACRKHARLAAACAQCHADAGVVPDFDRFPLAPADAATVDARMARHRWAIDRLWEGMIGGSDKPWRAGLDLLADAPLAALAPERHARTLQRLADDARRRQLPVNVDDRASVYGELLATCARCHAQPAARN